MSSSVAAPASTRVAGPAQGFALIFLTVLPTMAIVSLVPNLPQLFAHFHDVPHSELLVPMIITLPSLCIALFSPFAGAIADRWGRRRLLLAATLLYAAVGLLPVLLTDLHAVLVTRFFIGIAEAAILTGQSALMGDYFEGERRQRWLGLMSVIGPVAASALVLLGGYLGSLVWRGPFFMYLLGLPMFAWVWFVIFEPEGQPHRADEPSLPKSAFPWGPARVVALVTVCIAVLYYIQAVQLGRMFGDHGIDTPQQISIYVSIASLGVMTGGWLFSRLVNVPILGRFALIFFALGIGYTGIGLATTKLAALAFAFVAQVGNGLTIPTLIGWALSKFDFEHRGRGMGVWGSSFFFATFLSPPIVTVVQKFAGTFLHTVAVFGVLCLVLALLTFGASRRPGAAKAAQPAH
jgi:MFS family permease